jgi:hypothetical protein
MSDISLNKLIANHNKALPLIIIYCPKLGMEINFFGRIFQGVQDMF